MTVLQRRKFFRPSQMWLGGLGILGSIILLLSTGLSAWTPLTDGGAGATLGTVSRWDLNRLENGQVPYQVNLARPADAVPFVPADVTDQDLLDEIFGGLNLFTELTDSELSFRYDGTTDTDWGFDLRNVITFRSEGFPDFRGGPVFVFVTSAIVPGTIQTPGGETVTASLPGEILDADILFDPEFTVEVGLDGPTGSNLFDLRGIIATSVSLIVGVDGSGLASSLFRSIGPPRLGYDARRLTQDDQIAFAALYPSEGFLAASGSIRGRVTDTNGDPVFGAHVVAMDAATGVIVTSTLTGLAQLRADGMPLRYSAESGDYILVGLPPGDYEIFVEPLDGPNQGLLNGVFGDELDMPVVDVGFASATFDGAVTATAGELVEDIDLIVSERPIDAPNLSPVIFLTDSTNEFFESARLAGGGSQLMSVSGENLQNGATLLPGTTLSVSGDGVTLSNMQARESDVLVQFTVAEGALPGPRLLTWSNANGSSTLAGGVTVLPTPNPAILPLASVLPSSRSVTIGSPATAFASVINAGTVDALDCRVSPQTAVPGEFFFQPTDPATNAAIGVQNEPVDIPAGTSQTFVFGFTPTAPIGSTAVGLGFVCGEVNEAPSFVGLNTLQLAASEDPVPDVVALGATINGDGIVRIPGADGTGFFSVATVNVGAGAMIRAGADTGDAQVPAVLSMCQTNPETGVCINPTTPTTDDIVVLIETNETPTFAVFVQGMGDIALDPAGSRVFVRFTDANGLETGSTSVAVQTEG